jgi:hypothetical protein
MTGRARVNRVPDRVFYPWYRLVWWLDGRITRYADRLDGERRRRRQLRKEAAR